MQRTARHNPEQAQRPAELDDVVRELYALAPSEFTSARNARAAQARGRGERELERELQSLRKPTVAAWLANLLVRERPRELARLVGLGATLRKAQTAFDGNALRRLSQERHDVVGALSRDALALAKDRGQKLSDAAVRDLEETLEAAVFDARAAEQLQLGRLTGRLEYSGIGFDDPLPGSTVAAAARTGAAPGAPAGEQRGATGRRQRAGGRSEELPERVASPGEARSESKFRQAQRSAQGARRAADRAAAALATAERAYERHQAAVSAAQEELVRRRELARAAQQELARARRDRDTAEKGARLAQQRVEALQVEAAPSPRRA
jgi:hypothetical protein